MPEDFTKLFKPGDIITTSSMPQYLDTAIRLGDCMRIQDTGTMRLRVIAVTPGSIEVVDDSACP